MYRIRGKAQIRLHVSSTLAHAVNLGLLEVKIVGKGGRSEYCRDGKDSLSANACENYI